MNASEWVEFAEVRKRFFETNGYKLTKIVMANHWYNDFVKALMSSTKHPMEAEITKKGIKETLCGVQMQFTHKLSAKSPALYRIERMSYDGIPGTGGEDRESRQASQC